MFKVTVGSEVSIWRNKSKAEFIRFDTSEGESTVRIHALAELYGIPEDQILIEEILNVSSEVAAAKAALTSIERSEGVFIGVVLNQYNEPTVTKLQTKVGRNAKLDRLRAAFIALIDTESMPGGIIANLLAGNPTATQQDILDALDIQDADLAEYAAVTYGLASFSTHEDATPTVIKLEEITILSTE